MPDFFRVKIAGKRQVTLPQLMLNELGLREGDELEFTIAEGAIRAVRAFRLVPLDYFTPDVRKVLDSQVAQMDAGIDGGFLQTTEQKTWAESAPKVRVLSGQRSEVTSHG